MLAIMNIPDVKKNLARRFRERRLSHNISQATLAEKSGVSLGSIKRFELEYEISLSNMLKLSMTLECLEDFTKICTLQTLHSNSIDTLLKNSTTRKRGQL